jgi:uncharacterized protein YjbI with pentapeptide repeats
VLEREQIAAAGVELAYTQRETSVGTPAITSAILVPIGDLHLEGANLRLAHLEGANLFGAHLEQAQLEAARLDGAVLTGAHLSQAQLQGASLRAAHLQDVALQGANLRETRLDGAHLEHARLSDAYLEGASLVGAHLEQAYLRDAHLQGAVIYMASLQGADLEGAYLEGADLRRTCLEGANLRAASFAKASRLSGAILTGAYFDQVTFESALLTGVDWTRVDILGDERCAHEPTDGDGRPKERAKRLAEYQAAVRANRVLAIALQGRGLGEDAARFAYRAHVLQRQVLRQQRKIGAYLCSALLAVLAGYGHRPGRILCWYVSTVLGFALAYAVLGLADGHSFNAGGALILSVTTVHGRGFFPANGDVTNPVTILAVLEAVTGLVLELTSVGLLTQRFIGAR